MSAVNAVIYPDCAVLLTDAARSQDGVICGLGSKVHIMPQCPAAIGVTGGSSVTWIAETFIAEIQGDFDALVGRLVSATTDGVEAFHKEVAEDNCPFDIVAVGYSAKAGRCQGWQCNYTPGEGVILRDFGPIYLQPWLPSIEARAASEGLNPNLIAKLDKDQVAPALVRMMGVQRVEGAKLGEIIGGFQQCTVVMADGVFTNIAHRWTNDRIGEAITA